MAKKGSLAKEANLKASIKQRLLTAVGHLSAVERMVEGEQYCIDILKQIAAVQGILTKAARDLAQSHITHCVHDAVEVGRGPEAVDELFETLKYLRHF